MKKIVTIILLIILVCTLSGCTDKSFLNPHIHLCQGDKSSNNTIYVFLRENHNFVINHLYDEVNTDNGYDIIIHVEKIQ